MADGVPTWEEVARDHGRLLYNVAYRLAGNDDDAQDLVQEALIRVRKGLERYEPGSLEGWLARMFYVSLYRMHQVALYGPFRTAMLMLGSKIGRGTEPRLKLH